MPNVFRWLFFRCGVLPVRFFSGCFFRVRFFSTWKCSGVWFFFLRPCSMGTMDNSVPLPSFLFQELERQDVDGSLSARLSSSPSAEKAQLFCASTLPSMSIAQDTLFFHVGPMPPSRIPDEVLRLPATSGIVTSVISEEGIQQNTETSVPTKKTKQPQDTNKPPKIIHAQLKEALIHRDERNERIITWTVAVLNVYLS